MQPNPESETTSTVGKPTWVAAIDQGTSSSRFIVFDPATGDIVAITQTEFPQIYPNAGWCEHNPEEGILRSVEYCIRETCRKIELETGFKAKDVIQAVGITNQRETAVVWDAITGKSLHNAIVWLDARTTETVASLIERTPTRSRDHFRSKCGLPFSTYFSAVKLRWILDHSSEVAQAQREQRLKFGTVDSWLIYQLTGGASKGVHVTDVTNASRTMLMSLESLEWDSELCEFFAIDKSCLPAIRSSAEVYGTFASGPLEGVPIAGCLGDQQAALVGQRCFQPGEVKNTYGTGCFMLHNTGPSPVVSRNGLLTTVAYKLGPDEKAAYALEGSVSIAGAAIKWLRDNMGIIKTANEINELAAAVPDTGDVYFVPAFNGLFAPYWREDARGTIVGLTQYSTRHHLARATLESVCFQTRALIEAMNSDSGHPLVSLKVDGGMTNSDLAMQLQSDILGIRAERPLMRETTALGAAFAAGLAVGVFQSAEDFVKRTTVKADVFEPRMGASERELKFDKWKKAIERSLGWADTS
ncbi:glycerol kinase-like protein [Gonapodya prolifera JEL478]|uniref:Probable glycerol kinase n=1 Tax=Gonapodya prolifera (strain JEL478) TaxID=1344416 RepID=A0A139ARN4_GONPJ|nr:glycerol kinase-like protein [Gonapodya prolifera JEL478]|eukprot:KXS19324.1 glycerol kinase-like protein [Gonapodya prolifera JEL478]